MTEEEKIAEEYFKTTYPSYIGFDTFTRDIEDAVIYGLKARIKWHKVADGDLPELPADYFDNVSEWVLMDEEERESLAKEGDAPKKGEKTYSMADLAKFIDEMKAKREEKSEKQKEEAMSAESKAMELRRIAEEAFRSAGVAVSV